MDAPPDVASDASRLRARGLRVTGPRLAILAMLKKVGGHRSADELVAALRQGGYHHARTTVYNALDDLARAGLVRAAPVDAGALRYESLGEEHHHFVCRSCGRILNVPVASDLAGRAAPAVEGATVDEVDVIYRGLCASCVAKANANSSGATASGRAQSEMSVSSPPAGQEHEHGHEHEHEAAAQSGDRPGHDEGHDDERPDDDDGEMFERVRALG